MNMEYEFKNSEVEQSLEQPQQITYENANFIEQKYSNGSARLKIYVDEEENKYYIIAFAASSLGLISYKQATKLFDNGKSLVEITPETLHVLNTLFRGRLDYVSLSTKKNINTRVSNSYDDFYDNEYSLFDNNMYGKNKR